MPKLSEKELPEEAFYQSLDLKSEGVERLMLYLVEEHRLARSAYEEYFNELKIYRRAIAAKPATKVKTFPWPGASNFVAPIIRIAGDAIKARIVNSLLAPKPFWIVTSTSSTYSSLARPNQQFMEWSAKNDVNIAEAVETIADQVVYLGKCPVKIHWIEEVRKVRTYDRRTRREIYLTKTVRDQPILSPILLENWLEPWGIECPWEKPWNSQRVFLRAGDLLEKEKQGLLKNAVELSQSLLKNLPEDMVESGELRKLAWAGVQIVELYETQVAFDIDGDGFREELIVLWNYDSGIPLTVKPNFFFHGHRPTDCFFYLQNSNDKSNGDGIAQLLWPIQDAISSFVNQRADNITIANTRYYKARKNSGVKKGEQIWPGKVFLLDDPVGDLVADKLGDVSPASFTHESLLRDYGERQSGVSDPQLGREFDNPRVAATTTLSILQEGNRRFDMVLKLMREKFDTVGVRILQLYQQFKPRVRLGDILSPEDELLVQQTLDLSPEEIERNFMIQVNTSTISTNKESQRQGLLALFNIITGFYSQVNQVALQLIANPKVPDAIKDMIIEMAETSYKTLKDIILTFDINNPDEFLVNVADALRFVKGGGGVGSIEQMFQEGLRNFMGVIEQESSEPAVEGTRPGRQSVKEGGSPGGQVQPEGELVGV